MMKKTLATLTLMVLSLSLLSCNKGKETEGDFGQEVSDKDLSKVISKATSKLDPTRIKVGQSVSHIVSLRVENSERFRPMMWDRNTVLSKEVTPQYYRYIVKVEEKDLSVEPNEEKVYEDVIEYSTAPEITKSFRELTQIGEFSKASLTKSIPTQVKYYNMKEYPLTLSVPEAVGARPNCGDMLDCKMNVHHLEFDEVTWYSDGRVQKIRWLYEISPEVPFLANITTVCASQLIDWEGSRVYVRNCRYAVDFNF